MDSGAQRTRGKAERRWQERELPGRDSPYGGQYVLDLDPLTERGQGRRATGEVSRGQGAEPPQRVMHWPDPPTRPADRPGQIDIGTQAIGRGLHTPGLLRGENDGLDLLQLARESRGKAVSEKTEGTMTLGTIPARDARAWRADPLVGAVA